MSKTIRQVLASCLVALVAAGVGSVAVWAASGTDAIKARQAAMEKVGDAIGALAAIAKKEAPFDAAVVKTSAETIAAHLKKAEAQFPAGSEKGDVETWAKAEIWSDPEMFAETMKKAQAAAVALQSVGEEAAFRPALGQLGGNCKACHEMYRLPKP